MKDDTPRDAFPRLLVLVFFFLLLGTCAFFLIERQKPISNLLTVFPNDSLLVIEWDNAAQTWQHWRNSLAVSKKVSSRLLNLFDNPEQFASLIGEIDNLAMLYDSIATYPIVRSLVSAPAALAVLPEAGEQTSVPISLARQWVLAVRAEAAFSIQHHPDLSQWIQLETTTVFQGETISHFSLPGGEKFVSWQRSDVVLCAREVRLLHRCIQLHLQRMVHQNSGLADNPTLQRLKGQSNVRTNVFCYADLERLQGRLAWLRELIEKAGVFQPGHIALYQYVGKQTNRVGGVVTFNREAIFAVPGFDHIPPPQGPLPGDFADATALLLWTNWFNFKEVWSYVVQHAHEEAATFLAAMEQAVTESMGSSIDSFFDVFGQRIGVFLNDQSIPYQSHQSLGCLAIEVRDRDKVERLIKQLITGLQVITVQSDATEVHTVMLAGGLLQPAYSLEKNRLFLADTMELIEQARGYFALDEKHSEQDQPIPRDSQGNVILFVRPDRVVERILPLLALAAKENGERNRMFAPKTRLNLRENILPLLTTFQDWKTFSLRGSVTGDSISVGVEYALDQN